MLNKKYKLTHYYRAIYHGECTIAQCVSIGKIIEFKVFDSNDRISINEIDIGKRIKFKLQNN
jgi:hypothetical protein